MMVEEKEKTTKEVIEKASAINLLVAFAYATRNYLREDYSYDEPALRELISHIPKFSTPSSNQPLEDQEEDDHTDSKLSLGKLRKGSLKDIVNSATSSSPSSKKGMGPKKSSNLKAYETPVPTNIPIELSYYIASYINSVRQRGLVDPSTVTVMNNGKLTHKYVDPSSFKCCLNC